MKRESLVSVIIPVFNTEKYLGKCLESIINQTYKYLEIILVDDGSTDSCREIYEAYKKKDKRIKVINQENVGVSKSRSIGIENANGKYIAFVDSDDYISKQYISRLVRMAEINDAEIVQCEAIPVDNDDMKKNAKCSIDINKIKKRSLTGIDAVRLMLYQSIITSSFWGKLIRRNTFTNVEFPRNLIHEDLYVMYFLLKKSKNVVVTNEPLYMYRVHNDSLIHSDFSKSTLDILKVMNAIRKDVEKNPELDTAFDSRTVNADLYVLRQLPKEYMTLKKELFSEVRKLRWPVLKDPMVRKKTKFGLIMSLFGLPVVKVVYNVLGSGYNARRVQ